MVVITISFIFNFRGIREEGGQRNKKNKFVFPHVYALIGSFLYVSGQGSNS